MSEITPPVEVAMEADAGAQAAVEAPHNFIQAEQANTQQQITESAVKPENAQQASDTPEGANPTASEAITDFRQLDHLYQTETMPAQETSERELATRLEEVESISDDADAILSLRESEAGNMLEMWQREGRQMQPLIEYLKEQRESTLQPETWKQMSLGARVSFLQGVQDRMAQQYGFTHAHVELRASQVMQKKWGEFEPNFVVSDKGSLHVGIIRINDGIIDDPFQAVSTTLHESRHAFQWAAVEHPEIAPPELRAQIPDWRANQANYITAEKSAAGYWNQSLEQDARSFAGIIRVLYDADYRNSLAGEQYTVAKRIQAEVGRNRYDGMRGVNN
jgi:hypothetical protein